MKFNKTAIFLSIFLIGMGTWFSFYYYKVSKEIKQPKLGIITPNGNNVRPFKFVDQNGDTVTNKDIENKIVVVEYFFTTCKGICPIMNENMVKVHNAFKTNDNVIILSHTVDPKRDSIPAMKAYSMKFDINDKNWRFLTGDKKELYDQAYYSYLLNALEEREENIDDEFIHSNLFVLLDKNGRIRMHLNKDGNTEAYDGTNEASVGTLIKDIQYLLTEEQ
jgi:protein SCO1/2